jgi:hypothetical protein
MLYVAMLLLGALLVLASDRIEAQGIRTLVFIAGEAVFGATVVAAVYGLLRKVIAVLRSDQEQEDS